MGLVESHAYAFTGAGWFKVKGKAKPQKMVQIHNPWAYGEWSGAYSEDKPEFKHFCLPCAEAATAFPEAAAKAQEACAGVVAKFSKQSYTVEGVGVMIEVVPAFTGGTAPQPETIVGRACGKSMTYVV